ncbi:MAG: hypothetical protein RMJ98_09435 [Myxococcales bacterium]|nr:hypothetical protein [Polyangiaceae bacterium]MDW8249509.1 hypothetical protein [Myxococcales bacterium]
MSHASRSLFAAGLSLAAAVTTLTFAPKAKAFSSCKADADCAAGFFCELVPPPSVGCASPDGQSSECPEPGPAPAVEGYCREKPIECKADADCPDYLACVSSGGGEVTCWAPACNPGEECPEPVCEEPKKDPNAPMVCAPKMIECTADAECPKDFACNIELGTACPTIACDPTDPNCKPPECDQTPKKLCGPKLIDCKADGDCPSDWRCLSFEEGSCSGGGGTEPPSTGKGSKSTPKNPGSQFADECTVITRNLCVPKGYLAGIEQGGTFDSAQGSPMAEAGSTKNDGSKAPTYSIPRGSDTQPTSGSASEPSGDGGCSTSHGGQGAGPLNVLFVGLAARLVRRRSR